MSKFSKLMIITLLLILTACNSPQTQPKTVTPDTEIIEPATDTPQAIIERIRNSYNTHLMLRHQIHPKHPRLMDLPLNRLWIWIKSYLELAFLFIMQEQR